MAFENSEPIRHISDTALWAAIYRADETDRADALFRDPYARRLAGARGQSIAEGVPRKHRHAWAWVVRTVLVDRIITAQIQDGVDTVINLAAGLDARPYRMTLPSTLTWIEVDLPALVAAKEAALQGERPHCALERVPLDLADVEARRALFDRIGRDARRALVITEGLLIYLSPEEVRTFAGDLARPASFERWVLDLASPGLLKLMQKQIGGPLDRAGAPLKFAPAEGPEFFQQSGWTPLDVRSQFTEASKLRRLPFPLSLFALLPQPDRPRGNQPWSGICLMART
ncbi:MAG: class I SAM-dependent methyltransferase [Acidobacteriota bacterium]|nr:class I SAM-dependent methyltransferase [Acidobacteriota bacterium]